MVNCNHCFTEKNTASLLQGQTLESCAHLHVSYLYVNVQQHPQYGGQATSARQRSNILRVHVVYILDASVERLPGVVRA